MSSPILLLPPRYSDDSNALWRAALELDWPIERLQSWNAPSQLYGQKLAIYGESLWAHHIAQQLGCRLLEPADNWLATLPHEFLSRRIEFGSLGEARQQEFPLFVKPANEKAFPAQVYQEAEELPAVDFWPEDMPVLMSEPVHWEVEFRCFVLKGKVLTFSPYWRGEVSAQVEDGSYSASDEEKGQALEFANVVLKHDSQLPAAVVLDVGRLKGGHWAVIEANPAYGAGIYGCDAKLVLEVVAGCCEPLN